MDYSKYCSQAIENGFSKAAPCDPAKLKFLPAVRDMCADGKCQRYGRNWACPPHCGELSEWAAKSAKYTGGIIVETIYPLEDSFDFEGMADGEKKHKDNIFRFLGALKAEVPDVLVMTAGSCNLCDKCTCPDSPCRLPAKRISSMEACGLMVSDVCRECGVPYTNGANTVTYISLYLF